MIATKEEECQVLEKIKQMAAELGENSYLVAAFTGAFELAEQNIENDWNCTMTEKAECMEREAEEKTRKARVDNQPGAGKQEQGGNAMKMTFKVNNGRQIEIFQA
jgi:hypothetical protein